MMSETNSWQKVTIGQLGRVITGKTPPTIKPEMFGTDYPFITPTDMQQADRVVSVERSLSEIGRSYQKNLLLPSEAVCFVCIGATIGKVCITSQPAFTNQKINSVVVNNELHDSRFVYYLLRNNIDRIKRLAGGAATPILNKTAFSSVGVTVPPLPIQRKIAAVLSAYDDLIENNARRIAILEEMAAALYREWFVEFRFPGHENVPLVESKLGLVPQGWEVQKLGEMCDMIMGQSPESQFYNDKGEGLPFHQGVRDFGLRFPTDRIYCTVQNRVAQEGDVLFSVRAPVGRLNLANKAIVLGRGVSAIRSKTKKQCFLFQQLKERFQEENTMGSGAIFQAVTKQEMFDVLMLNPCPENIEKFEIIAKPIFKQLETLSNSNANLCQTRDLLLPRLISGEVDVSQLPIAGVPDEGGSDAA